MGLDWNPLARPKPGMADEWARILATDLDGLGESERESMLARFLEITDPPYAVVEAPRVGLDPSADGWLRERLREQGSEGTFDQTREQMRGYYVLDLAPPSPGLPVYSSMGYEGVDRYTFRGQFLDDARHIIGDTLYQRAWERMTASELHGYGDALLDAARRFASPRGLGTLEYQREPPTDDDADPAWGAHIAFSAAAWCLWWSQRGFGLDPYY
jgi:hypothetical protein